MKFVIGNVTISVDGPFARIGSGHKCELKLFGVPVVHSLIDIEQRKYLMLCNEPEASVNGVPAGLVTVLKSGDEISVMGQVIRVEDV